MVVMYLSFAVFILLVLDLQVLVLEICSTHIPCSVVGLSTLYWWSVWVVHAVGGV